MHKYATLFACCTALLSMLLGTFSAVADDSALETRPLNLLADKQAWKEITPFVPDRMTFQAVQGDNQELRLKIRSEGSPRDVGGWIRDLPRLDAGKRYDFQVEFTVDGIQKPQRRVWALITSGGQELQEFEIQKAGVDRYISAVQLTPVKDLRDAELRLYLTDTMYGAVTFESATLRDISSHYRPRTAHLAAISGRPKNAKTPQDAIDFYISKIDQVAGQGIDLVCLPENINTDTVPGDRWAMLEPIPGPTTLRLAAKARQHNVYIAASIAERDGSTRYNTAVLIDRQGTIVAKYRKTHLTVGEQLMSGITPGSNFVVHQTDFGKVGLMVCYDHHFAEVPRILALQGAEILVMPNAADGREKGSLWESAMRMRAVDNQVFIVSAVNFGRSLVAAPDGSILAVNDRASVEPGGFVHAVCEIGDSVANQTGQPIGKRYLQMRRPEIYSTLLRDINGELKPNLDHPAAQAP